ncbi:hypothetical protein GOV03_01665 [Candidatus Woesearchaeota archaeon]|nr:hypothetical protein [Candidatus Woesearchaeota archaeon]
MPFLNIASYFQAYGIIDFLLPFLLVFTIIFAVLQKVKLFGDDTKKQFNVIIALVMALIFIVPHMTGSYPLGYDPVQVINEALPSISLVAIASVMLLLLLGIFGGDFAKAAMPIIAVAAIIFVVYIFGSTSALNLWQAPNSFFDWWTPALTELLIIILIFGLIVWFITKEPGQGTPGKDIVESFGKLFKKNNE